MKLVFSSVQHGHRTGTIRAGLVAVEVEHNSKWSRGPAIHPPSSSRVALNVIFNFAAEILLVTQMMLCSLNIQRIVKIQKISK